MEDDDKGWLLSKIAQNHGASIVSQLVGIAKQRNQLRNDKILSFTDNLECLKPFGTKLHRWLIGAHKKQYVALSYTSTPSEDEAAEYGQYRVENWDDDGFTNSTVRNCVFNRVLRYMKHFQVELLWIDAHCIRQETCSDGECTGHERCDEKRHAIDAMDRVYGLSKHPVALLGRPLKTASELRLLARLMSGALVKGDSDSGSILSAKSYVDDARKTLRLLCRITRDKWWERAWTFQENYRGGQKMRLLISHDLSLESQKCRYDVFGKIKGELCIRSVDFSEEATKLCEVLRQMVNFQFLPPDADKDIDAVLRAAGKYTLTLSESSCMTPRVITDLEMRDMSRCWDRLSLVANCCQYPIRLDVKRLKGQNHSLSLSMMAMCLLNGEILDNSKSQRTSAAGLKTSMCLEELTFKSFCAPEDDTRPLTFNKGCRLSKVELRTEGIFTKGHVWKLGRVIDTSDPLMFGQTLPWIDNPHGRLSLFQRKLLLQLANRLDDFGYEPLSTCIRSYLIADENAGEDFDSFTEMYLHRMAVELAGAIERRQKLRLGVVWDSTDDYRPCLSVFVCSREDGIGASTPPDEFVFTSMWPGHPGSETHDFNDIDRHVSVEVDLEEPRGGSAMPFLHVRRWLHGMCFFRDCPRIDVIFPWPRALQEIEA